LLQNGGEPRFADGNGVASGSEAQECKMAVRAGCFRLREIRIKILGFNGCARDAPTFLIENIPLHRSASDLRLSPPGRGKPQRECKDKKHTQPSSHFLPPRHHNPNSHEPKDIPKSYSRLAKTNTAKRLMPGWCKTTRFLPV